METNIDVRNRSHMVEEQVPIGGANLGIQFLASSEVPNCKRNVE